MAGPVYAKLVTSLLQGNKEMLDLQPSAYVTDLPVHTVTFRLVGWFSMVCGGLLFVEQYLLRRISCFEPREFTQPTDAICEYCWEHGSFSKNVSMEHGAGPLLSLPPFTHNWVLQAYAYFIVRSFVFALPHIIWSLKYRPFVQSLIKSTVDVIKELECLWLRHGEKADHAYRQTREQLEIAAGARARTHHELRNSLRSIKAMTRDVIQITHHQVPHYKPLLTFVQLRMVFEIIFLTAFVFCDFWLFLLCIKYDSTDFHCPLPNGEVVRCMTPMMQLLVQLVLLSLLASCFTLLMTTGYSLHLIHDILSTHTKHCFFQHVPYADLCEDCRFQDIGDRKIYKLLSRFLMHNYCIIQPLNFLKSFVKHLEDNKQVHIEVLRGNLNEEEMVTGEKEDACGRFRPDTNTDAWDNLITTDI